MMSELNLLKKFTIRPVNQMTNWEIGLGKTTMLYLSKKASNLDWSVWDKGPAIACLHTYLRNPLSKLHKFSVHVACGHSSIVLEQQSNMICRAYVLTQWPGRGKRIGHMFKLTNEGALGSKPNIYDCLFIS